MKDTAPVHVKDQSAVKDGHAGVRGRNTRTPTLRLLLTLALSGLILGLASCGKGDHADADGSSTSTSTSRPRPAEPIVAATPPMGWNSWNRVRCHDLDEAVVKQAADALVRRGLKDLGYRYVVVDDCWQAPSRDSAGALVADPIRFPSGLESLVDYVHDKGLKFGLYLAPGSETCAMHWDDYAASGIGSYRHERQDAEMLDELGVDYLKYDWCRADETDGLEHQKTFGLMRDELARLDRPIVYSISEYGDTKPWTWAPKVANLWRTTSDIIPFWPSVASIIDQQAELHSFSGPGRWNDPDMLQVGNGPLTPDETRAHIGMWAMLAAPLMIGTDLDKLTPDVIDALSNPEIIAIDQDPAGRQASRLRSGETEVWARSLADGDMAVALLNKGDGPAEISTTITEVGAQPGSWSIRNASTRKDLPATDGPISETVAPHGVTVLRLSS